jgi:hypothetical protein
LKEKKTNQENDKKKKKNKQQKKKMTKVNIKVKSNLILKDKIKKNIMSNCTSMSRQTRNGP